MSSFVVNPVAVPTGAASTVVNCVGQGTLWLSAPPVLTALAGVVSTLAVTTDTKCSFHYASPDTDQTDTITDSTSGFASSLIVSSNQTLQDIIDWVATDTLHREDLQASLASSVCNLYTTIVRKVPFDEFMYTTTEYNLTVGQASYNLIGLNPPIWPPLDAISSIRLTYGPSGSNSVRLRRSATRLYDAISYSNFNSRPSTYARWGTAIEVNPPPDSSNYTFRFRYRAKAVLNNPNPENTIILVDAAWNELFRWELLYRAYYSLGMYSQAAVLVTPPNMPRQPSPRRQVVFETGIIPRLWNDLLATISAKEAPDEDFSINPVVRGYSLP